MLQIVIVYTDFTFKLLKEYFKFLNRLYDITWFGAFYA